MKQILLIACALLMLCVGNVYAQDVATDPSTAFTVDLGTFAGIVTLVSTLVTQVAKLIPSITNNKLAKIGISVGVGIVICMISWLLQITPLLVDYLWWQVLLFGVATGLSGCGFYDVVKAIGNLLLKK